MDDTRNTNTSMKCQIEQNTEQYEKNHFEIW